MKRKRFIWKDPDTKKKYELFTTQHFVRIMTKVIKTEDQAEDFVMAYQEASDDAEYNLGYFARFIKSDKTRERVLELFAIEPQLEPRQVFKREYSFSERIRNG